jgi:hypothetical protein
MRKFAVNFPVSREFRRRRVRSRLRAPPSSLLDFGLSGRMPKMTRIGGISPRDSGAGDRQEAENSAVLAVLSLAAVLGTRFGAMQGPTRANSPLSFTLLGQLSDEQQARTICAGISPAKMARACLPAASMAILAYRRRRTDIGRERRHPSFARAMRCQGRGRSWLHCRLPRLTSCRHHGDVFAQLRSQQSSVTFHSAGPCPAWRLCNLEMRLPMH